MPRRSLVLVAGIPGAGKSTLLHRLRAVPDDAVVLDSDQVRERLRAWLPPDTPYHYYRPLVHLWHRVRIVLALFGAPGPVVAHLPSTGAATRAAVVILGALAGRHRSLVWVHADPEQARRGQHSRGRVLGGSCFERHARHGEAFVARLRDGYRPKGWHDVTVLDRRHASHGLLLRRAG